MPKWTDIQIIAMVGALAVRFPVIEVSHWNDLRDCVEAARALLRAVNEKMTAAETDRNLSPQGAARKVADVARQALAQLDDFGPLKKGEGSVARQLEAVTGKMTALPAASTNAAEISLAAEIRDHVSKQKDPALFVLKNINDPRVVAAVLQGPPFLSELTDEQVQTLRVQALNKLYPDQVEEQEKLNWALKVCRDAIGAAQRMIAKRADMRRDADGWRHITESEPKAA